MNLLTDYRATLSKKVLSDFLKPIAAISKTDDTVQMEFTSKGIHIIKFSADHVSVLTSTLFDDNASEGLQARLSLKRLMDAVGACGETIALQITPQAVTVGDGHYTRIIRTDAPEDISPRPPRMDGEPIDLSDYCGRLQNVVLGDTVSFAWGKEGIEIGSSDETGTAWYAIPADLGTEGEATFPSEYAVGLLRAIPKDAKVTAYLTDSAPIKVDYSTQDYEGSILIASRISKEDE